MPQSLTGRMPVPLLTRVALVGTPNATDGVWEGPPNAD